MSFEHIAVRAGSRAALAPRSEAAGRRAAALYDNGSFCSEAVLAAVREIAPDPMPPEIVKLATGFCGEWTEGHPCGALAGGIMAIGLLAGRTSEADDWTVPLGAVAQLERRFSATHGGTLCLDIVRRFGCMGAPGRHEHCTVLVGETARLVVDIAEERGLL